MLQGVETDMERRAVKSQPSHSLGALDAITEICLARGAVQRSGWWIKSIRRLRRVSNRFNGLPVSERAPKVRFYPPAQEVAILRWSPECLERDDFRLTHSLRS